MTGCTGFSRLRPFPLQSPALVYVMGSVTCARCWQDLRQLARWWNDLRHYGVVIYVVSNGRYTRQAQELASFFSLPVTFIQDPEGVVAAQYQLSETAVAYGQLILLDAAGQPRYLQSLVYGRPALTADDWLPVLPSLA